MKVGLVLGAGGVLGGAWLTGGLHALARETGWDPGSADFIVGHLGRLDDRRAHRRRRAAVVHGRPLARARASTGWSAPTGAPPPRPTARPGPCSASTAACPRLGPGSLRMASTALSNPLRRTRRYSWSPAGCPPGVISTDSLKDIVRRAVPGRWVDHPNYWAVACDYSTGRRVPFGRADAPAAELADAVAASCAIPGFYRPVRHRQSPLRGRRGVLGVEPRPARGARARSRDLHEPALVARRARARTTRSTGRRS